MVRLGEEDDLEPVSTVPDSRRLFSFRKGDSPEEGDLEENCSRTTDWTCNDPKAYCGTGGTHKDNCICNIDIEGNSYCWANDKCSDMGVKCDSSSDCNPGYRCVTHCCGDRTAFCTRACPKPSDRAVRREELPHRDDDEKEDKDFTCVPSGGRACDY